jgi:alkylation response protein AidB-like acyl-CoA dehydrogenase
MFNKAGEPIGPGIALVPISDVQLLHDWDTSGIRGSGSTNVTMENVFIPHERIVGLLACNNGEQPRANENALYRTAFAPLMAGILAYPVLGLGQHMLEAFLEGLPKRDIKLTSYSRQGEAPVTHLQIADASSKIDAAKLIIETTCREMDDWAASDEYMPRLQRARICRDTAFADRLVWEAVDLLGSAAGGSFSRNDSILNRIWQDVKVGGLHPFVSRESNFETYGRMLAGVEPPLMLM